MRRTASIAPPAASEGGAITAGFSAAAITPQVRSAKASPHSFTNTRIEPQPFLASHQKRKIAKLKCERSALLPILARIGDASSARERGSASRSS
jgi:hypothetical protein